VREICIVLIYLVANAAAIFPKRRLVDSIYLSAMAFLAFIAATS
jgi:hypothetical protein